MPSTTIRYSTLPENSQPIDFEDDRPSRPELEHGRCGKLCCEPGRELDRELDLASVGLHFHRHRADPEPEVPASRVPGSRAVGRGVPDPNTPGAYRYDPADPSTCDQHLPDSDPRSPRYEPPHLRHQPGDTFEIGGKPYDPLDPGPYGSPGWFQDRRTGRHRRGELPDPLPEDDRPMPVPSSPAPVSSPPPAPIPSPAPPVDATTQPHPYRRYPRWKAPENGLQDHHDSHLENRFEDGAEPGRKPGLEADHRTGQTDSREGEVPYRFSPLRESAMQRFLELSQPFRDAHFQPQPPSFAERLVWVLRWVLWIATCGMTAAPPPLTAEDKPVRLNATGTDTTSTTVRLTASLPAHRPAAGGGLL